MGFLRQIFKKDSQNQKQAKQIDPEAIADLAYQDDEIELPGEDTLVSTTQAASERERLFYPLQSGYASHVGRVRKGNEDSILVVTSATAGDNSLPPFGLFVVADGMGGHSDGQMASQLASRIVAREVMRQIYTPFLQIDRSEPAKPVQDILSDAIQEANWEINAANSESGTTVTAALIVGNRAYLAHVGDSRAYLIQDGDAPPEQLTLDHSFVQRLEDAGQITHEEAAVHPQRNVLYRAVGQGDRLDVDTFSRPILRPCWLLLCSDGLWGVTTTELLQAVCTSTVTPQQACEELLDAALDAGGPDNISVIVVRLE